MTVYVDDLAVCVKSRNWPFAQACHLVADKEKELHNLAGRIGLKRSWFQTGSIPHYDLTAGKRALAIRAGAREIDLQGMGKLIRKQRKQRQRVAVVNVPF